MRVVNKKLLTDAQLTYTEAADQIRAWNKSVAAAEWSTPHDVRRDFPKVKIVGGKNVVFKILRNRYRLWVKVDYQRALIIVKKFGTHREYDNWDIK